ncbi:ABC transporter permease [Corynebacterium bovis]|uniref:ABC transporter permease n=1 Tax=Corynebacterium bovis TaxID=36808 RepID=UPI003138D9CD
MTGPTAHEDPRATPTTPADPATPTTPAGGRFRPGLFTPNPTPAPPGRLLLSQARIETLLFLRHGEQQLLSLVIPVCLLIGMTLLPIVDLDDPVRRVFPMALGVAVMSAGFTGQAIAVAFDRRYGALKRIGASGVPTWALIAGKIMAVAAAVVVQIVVLTVVALILGWRPVAAGIPLALIFIIVGVAAFTGLGLLLGGTLSSELVLALGNTIWFALMGAAVAVTLEPGIPDGLMQVLTVIPSVALTQGLIGAAGYFPGQAVAVLAAWAVLGVLAAMKHFSFTMDRD